MKTNLENVFTASEAAARWGLHCRTIISACAGQRGFPPRFKSGECRKAGGTWLITREGMERLYGKEE